MIEDVLIQIGKNKEGLVDQYLDKEDKRLLQVARGVDTVDRIVGPVGSSLQLFGSPFWQATGMIISIAELAFLKIPFMYRYHKQTKDFSSIYFWAGKEAIATGMHYGGVLDIFHSYTYLTRNHLENKIIKKENEA